MRGLTGKTAIVTGGAGGIGGAVALRLSEEGCRVVVVDIDGDGAAKTVAALPGDAIGVAVPLRRAASVHETAAVVAFLLSEDASYVNGVMIPVDGGTLADHARSWIAGQAARAGIIVGLEPV